MKGADGVSLAVRTWFDCRIEIQAIIFVFHGMGGHGGYYKFLAERIVHNGFLVVSPDLRGHGHSEGRRGDLIISDVLKDIEQLLNNIKLMYPGKPFFLLGESMGGCLVINFLRNYTIDLMNIQGVILFSPGIGRRSDYMSLLPYLFVVLAYIIIPGLPILKLDADSEDGLRVKKYSARYIYELVNYGKKALSVSMEGMNTALIIFHGANDHVVKAETVKRFYDDILNNNKELIMVDDGSHCLFKGHVFNMVFDKLRDFILMKSRKSAVNNG